MKANILIVTIKYGTLKSVTVKDCTSKTLHIVGIDDQKW